MYSTIPIPTEYPSHCGFYIIAFVASCIWLKLIYESKSEGHNVIYVTVLTAIIPTFAYFVSFKWSNQLPIVYKNEKVEATFVRFVAEGYSQTERSGKQTRQVDVHKQYVEYKVNGSSVLLPAKIGQTYPPKAILYKNIDKTH